MDRMDFGRIFIGDDRVYQDDGSVYKVVHLDHIDGVGLEHRSYLLLALLGLLLIGYAAMKGFDNSTERVSAVIGFVLILGFFVTRKTMLVVHAGTLVLKTAVGGSGQKGAKEFAASVVTAIEGRATARRDS